MEKWISDHPWMTFFIAIAALDSITYIVSGPPKIIVQGPAGTTPVGSPQLGAGHMAGAKLMPWLTPAAYMRPVG